MLSCDWNLYNLSLECTILVAYFLAMSDTHPVVGCESLVLADMTVNGDGARARD